MRYDTPCLKKDWHHAFLMSDSHEHVVIDGIEMTAKNIWEHEGDREKLLDKLVEHFYNEGFKKFDVADDNSVEKDFLKLVDASPAEALGKDMSLKNTSRLGLSICRRFCWDSFYATRVNGTMSINDLYKDKDALRKVLKNRMGWYTTTEKLKLEDGTTLDGEHPYLFDISHNMVVQGAHSSMTSANVSNFRPLVAKFLMSKFCPSQGKVLDLSMGWGARMLAAMSLGLGYYGIDPMTAGELDAMHSFLCSRSNVAGILHKMNPSLCVKLVDSVSEDASSYAGFPDDIDYCIACPPYFKLEEYSCASNSTDVYDEYNDWLEKYWRRTVHLMSSKLKPHGKFTLIMIEKWDKLSLLEDMSRIVLDEGFVKVDELSYKTTRSHLTDKRESKNISKNTEKVHTFEKL